MYHPAFPRDFGRGVCPQGGEQRSLLLVDRGSDVRDKIEALRPKHAVAVRQDGCNLEVLAACQVNARYRYAPITPKHDRVRLRDEVELYANVPLSAASLSGKLRSAGELDVDLTMIRGSARHRSSQGPTGTEPSIGFRCARTP